MTVERYIVVESEKVPSEEFNKYYSPILSKNGVFLYEIQKSSVTLINKRHQTYPNFTYKGKLTLVGLDKNNEKALSEIKSKGFSLEKVSENPMAKAIRSLVAE